MTKATGREHADNSASTGIEDSYFANVQFPTTDATKLRTYREEYTYDQVGNILALIHKVNGNVDWRRDYTYANVSNRLNEETAGGITTDYSYNAHGSMAKMAHLDAMEWDFAERLSHITRSSTDAYYTYDGSGQRVRKVVKKGSVVETRLYLGGFEIFRKSVGGSLEMARETLHVMDDKKRVAMVETLRVDAGTAIANPVPVVRYQLDNHLGSASLELDDAAAIISYEEYYPYGSTSYQMGRNESEVKSKRYRYTGKEKDEESGLYYHGARYYACWLGRWTAADPAGMVDGVNLYMYVRGNPVRLHDPNGNQTAEPIWDVPENVQTEEEFRNWMYDSFGAYIDGDVKITEDGGRKVFDYSDASLSYDEEVSDGDGNESPITGGGQDGISTTDPDAGTVGKPGFAESLIPIWGSGRDAVYNFQKGNYGWGTFYTVMAISDVFLLKSLATAGLKALGKGGAKVLAKESGEVAAKEGVEEVAEKATVETGKAVSKSVLKESIDDVVGKVGQKYRTFDQFKKAQGAAGKGMAWHHIVEQNADNLARFGADNIHNTNNLIKLPDTAGSIHRKVTGYYNSLMPGTSMRIRDYVKTLSLEDQYKFGIDALRRFGYTGPLP